MERSAKSDMRVAKSAPRQVIQTEKETEIEIASEHGHNTQRTDRKQNARGQGEGMGEESGAKSQERQENKRTTHRGQKIIWYEDGERGDDQKTQKQSKERNNQVFFFVKF